MGEDVMQVLEELNTSDRATVVMVTHDPRLAERTQRTVRIFDGRQVQ
jgi:putative ABC transport system ATP-binding protein